jgi:hypothetical protein
VTARILPAKQKRSGFLMLTPAIRIGLTAIRMGLLVRINNSSQSSDAIAPSLLLEMSNQRTGNMKAMYTFTTSCKKDNSGKY